ncbi:MAG: glycosyltransferase family 2 protein [Chlamydiia bacterium]|nr:glycosyltransferase family 2 protein [Chlamydiia bacterium]
MKYSIVIPFKNEEANVEALLNEIEAVMTPLQAPFETIAVEDGSDDQTLEILSRIKKETPWLRILKFSRNFGQSSAFDAGFKAAKGEFVITLDGDRQNDPADIPKLLRLIEDADLVCGIRKKRKDTLVKRVTSKVANFVRSRLCEDGVSDTGCSLKVYRKTCLEKIKLFNGMHRFLPALFVIEGFKVKEIPVNHRERAGGVTKYNFFNRSFNTIADLFAVRWMKNRRLKWQMEELP